MSDIISNLFSTTAVRFCPENKPFWYTSGKIGPYFVNTHFLYGSEKEATELLTFIDTLLSNRTELPQKIFDKVLKQYNDNAIYKSVINSMKEIIEKNINIDEIDYISGGERRDWFFSNIIAYLLKKPHISIFKNLDCIISNYDFTEITKVDNLNGKKVLHIADLVTTASSYVRAWIPVIEKLGAKMVWTSFVIDRMQGGSDILKNAGVQPLPVVQLDKSLFKQALDLHSINVEQQKMLNKYFDNPDETMKEFLINHPEFLENALNSDEKTKQRAKLLVEGNLYGLNL